MIDRETSLRWASQYDGADALRQAVRDRMLGRNVRGLAFGKTDEHPEDVIVALLQLLSAGDGCLDAIVAGWREARRCVDPLLEGLACENIPGELVDDAFARVFGVAERTGHAELRDGVFSDLQLAISSSGASGIHVQQVVAAASAYEPRESDRALWEPALEIEDIAAYAFQSLLRIGSTRTQISEFLERLIRHQYVDDWDISVWFIAGFARTTFGSDKDIVAALGRIREGDPSLWQKIRQTAPEDVCWSDRWESEVEARSRSLLKRSLTPRILHSEQAEPKRRASISFLSPAIAQHRYLVPNFRDTTSVSKASWVGASFKVLQRGPKWTRRKRLGDMVEARQFMQLLSSWADQLLWLSDECDITEVEKHA